MIGSTLKNRYKLESELGRGGMGTVYRAQDTLLDRAVAIKVITEINGDASFSTPGTPVISTPGSAGKARLLAEAQAAAHLNHPNIVTIYDVGEEEGLTYLVMELIQGQSLRHAQNLPLPDALRLTAQICAALEQAHQNGIIHRDLKPENILVTPSQAVKLMDFGLARRMDAPRLTQEGSILGTFAYIAPEIISGKNATPQSDLYALGLILYEIVTGRPAYNGTDLLTILSQHLHATVEPPSTHNPRIPPDLENLILRLLHKDPANRPDSAAEVQAVVERLLHPEDRPSPAVATSAQPLDRIVRGRLVARETELEEALNLWRQVTRQEGARVLLISGEPGIGKTRLVKELLTRASLSGSKTWLGECLSTGGAPYAPLAQTIEQANLSRIPSLTLADLITLAPALRPAFPDVPANPALEPQAEQQRLFESYATLCATVVERYPLMLVIDDAHWADSASIALLQHLIRRAARAHWRLMLVLTYRESDLLHAHALNELLAYIHRERIGQRIKLNRFTQSQTRTLLESLFAENISDEFLQGIYAETEGNPFFVEEICKALIDQGKIYRENGRWQRAAMHELSLPQSVRLAIETRISRLPETVQETLRTAAVFGRRFEFNTLLATGLQEEPLIEALEQAENQQLLTEVARTGGGTFAFSHALIPAALIESLSGLRRRRAHRLVAQIIAQQHPEDYESLAYHFMQAADDARALEYYIKAARRAQKVYANHDALRFYNEALQLLPEPSAERFDVLRSQNAIYDLLSLRDQQLATLQEMLAIAEKLNDQSRHCETLNAFASYYIETAGERTDQMALKALEIARTIGDFARAGQSLSLLGRSATHQYRDAQARRYFTESVEVLDKTDLKTLIALNLSWLALLNGRNGLFNEAQRDTERALQITREIGDKRLEAHLLRRLATNLFFEHERAYDLDKVTLALHYTTQAADLHRAIGDKGGECHDANVLGLCHTALNKPEEGYRYFKQSYALAELTNSQLGMYHAIVNLCDQYYKPQGKLEDAISLLDQQIQNPDFAGNTFILATLRAIQTGYLTLIGQNETAMLYRKEVLAQAREGKRVENEASSLCDIGYLYAEAQQYPQAIEYAQQAIALLPQIEEIRQHGYPYWLLGYIATRQFIETNEETFLEIGLQNARKSLEYADPNEKGARYEPQALELLLLLHANRLEEAQPKLAELRANLDELRLSKANLFLGPFYVCALGLFKLGNPQAAQDYLQIGYQFFQRVMQNTKNPSYLTTLPNVTLYRLVHELKAAIEIALAKQ